MPEEGASLSAGWEVVYGSMGVPTSVEGEPPSCPDCGEACPRVCTGRYRCPAHAFAVAG